MVCRLQKTICCGQSRSSLVHSTVGLVGRSSCLVSKIDSMSNSLSSEFSVVGKSYAQEMLVIDSLSKLNLSD